jgi:hypothetical protein
MDRVEAHPIRVERIFERMHGAVEHGAVEANAFGPRTNLACVAVEARRGPGPGDARDRRVDAVGGAPADREAGRRVGLDRGDDPVGPVRGLLPKRRRLRSVVRIGA